MSVERAIHELWGADFGLTALVPAERVFTGSACAVPDLPYVVLTRHESRPIARTSSGRWLEETAVRLAVWSAGLDEAKRIAAEIDRRFDRKSFEQAGVICLNMRRTKDIASLERGGAWRLFIEYIVLAENERGA